MGMRGTEIKQAVHYDTSDELWEVYEYCHEDKREYASPIFMVPA